MPELPPEERLLSAPASAGTSPARPRWHSGEVRGKTRLTWTFSAIIFGVLLVLGLFLAGTPAIWVPVALATMIGVGVPFVLKDARRGARWDMEGITFTVNGKDSHHLSWSQDFVVAADGRHLVADGVRHPLTFQVPATDLAWMMAAVYQHCWSAERKPSPVGRKWWHEPHPVAAWKGTAVSIGVAASAENAAGPALYVYRPGGNPYAWLPAIIPLANMVRQLATEHLSASIGFATAILAALAFIWLTISLGRTKQYGDMLFDDSDTVEVAEDGIHIWRGGKRSPALQYPREVNAKRAGWLPAGKLTLWSDGEQQYLVDPRRLVALPSDTPSRIIHAATAGAGRLGGRDAGLSDGQQKEEVLDRLP